MLCTCIYTSPQDKIQFFTCPLKMYLLGKQQKTVNILKQMITKCAQYVTNIQSN